MSKSRIRARAHPTISPTQIWRDSHFPKFQFFSLKTKTRSHDDPIIVVPKGKLIVVEILFDDSSVLFMLPLSPHYVDCCYFSPWAFKANTEKVASVRAKIAVVAVVTRRARQNDRHKSRKLSSLPTFIKKSR